MLSVESILAERAFHAMVVARKAEKRANEEPMIRSKQSDNYESCDIRNDWIMGKLTEETRKQKKCLADNK
jgi:hypothetical protein